MKEEDRIKALKLAKMVKLMHTVSAMRKSQKAYFQMRLKSDLQRSKQLENEVDKQLQLIESEQKNKPKSAPSQ